ncbi:MAG: hypothetical protein K8U57_00010 [Planctomycetes bacterium]|nr:hypothetical protein [Planctomycetota bacterium]
MPNPIEAVGAMVEGLQALKGVFDQLISTITPFVQAISPSTVQAFNQAMQDVQATIGSALVSSLQVFASVLREIGGVLLPLMQSLEPIFHQFAEAFGGVLVSVVRVVVSVLQAMIPMFQILADIVSVLADLFVDMTGLIVAIVKTLTAIFSDSMGDAVKASKEAFKGLADIVRQVVKALATFIATLLVGIGQREVVIQFAKSLQDEAKARDERVSGLKAAATNPAITDIQSINKQQQLASFTAAGGGAARERTDTEYLSDIAKALADKAATQKTFQEALSAWWDAVLAGNTTFAKVMKFLDLAQTDIKLAIDKIKRLIT